MRRSIRYACENLQFPDHEILSFSIFEVEGNATIKAACDADIENFTAEDCMIENKPSQSKSEIKKPIGLFNKR